MALAFATALLGCSSSSPVEGEPNRSPSQSPRTSSAPSSPRSGSDASEIPSPPAPNELRFDGPPSGAALSAEEAADVAFAVRAPASKRGDAEFGDLRLRHNGEDVTHEADAVGTRLTYAPTELAEGEHLVEVLPSRGDPLERWSFTVDTTDPRVRVTSPTKAVIAGEPVTVEGVTEPYAEVATADIVTRADDLGNFALELPSAKAGTLRVSVTDLAGNLGAAEVALLTVASRAEVEEIRAVHVSFCAWATPALRDPVLEMVEDGLVTAVQLDLKDETGTIGFETGIELADRIGADEPPCRIDLAAAVEELHERGVAVVGRIVAFADPVLAPWAWQHDRRDWVVQTADREMYTGQYAGFTNVANREVVTYNMDVAEEAAAAGVDHILWDYIRRPDGPAERFHFPGLEGAPREAIVEFTRRADERLAPYEVAHGASVYGISADRPTEVGQDIPGMAQHLDYVAPMLYPSHWGPGEYGVADPLNSPSEIIEASLEVWLEVTGGTRARVVPWLEDSNWPISLGYPDRRSYVNEQIRATYDRGIDEWMLWDSAVSYTSSGIVPPGE